METRSIKWIMEVDFPEISFMPFEVAKAAAQQDGVEFFDTYFGEGHENNWEMAGATVIEQPANIEWHVKLMVIQNPLKQHIPLQMMVDVITEAVTDCIRMTKEIENNA